MNDITMPDFDRWAELLITHNSVKEISQALKQAFEQGQALGDREGFLRGEKHILDLQHTQSQAFVQEWWETLDKDLEEQQRLEKMIDVNHPDVMQYLDKASGCYVAINKDTKKEIGRSCGGKPFPDLNIITKDQ